MTFAEQKTEVFRRLNESSSSPTYWTESDVEGALNEGYAEISDVSEWYERNASISKLKNRTYYDLRTNLSDTFLAPRRCFNPQTNQWLDPISVRTLDFKTYRQWELNPGEPQKMFMRGLWWLGIYPKAGADSGTLQLYYTALPTEMAADGDEPAFPQEFHLGIVSYALYELRYQERETAAALRYFAEYKEYETALRGYVEQRTSFDRSRGMSQ